MTTLAELENEINGQNNSLGLGDLEKELNGEGSVGLTQGDTERLKAYAPITDIVTALVKGGANTVGTVANIADMIGGGNTAVGNFAKSMDDYATRANNAYSQMARGQQEAIQQSVEDPNQNFLDVIFKGITNPYGSFTMGAESAPTMLVPGGAAKMAVNAARYIPGVTNAAKAVLPTVVGTNAAMNAADTWGELSDVPTADRLKGAGVSGLASLVASALTGGAAEASLARLLTNNVSKEAGKSLLKTTGKGAGKEFFEEFTEEGGNYAGEQVGKGENIDINQLSKRGTLGGVLAAPLGGLSGLGEYVASLPETNPQTAQQNTTDAKAVDQAKTILNNILATVGNSQTQAQDSGRTDVAGPTQASPTQPTQSVPEPAPKAAPEAEEKIEFNPENEGETVLQNRKRDIDASVSQMATIANKPDFARVGFSREVQNGAPIVAYGSIPQENLGRTDFVVRDDGSRMPVQYAVVEAEDISTSNDVNGAANEGYGDKSKVTAIAGNGRVAGITAAYGKGAADTYKQELSDDTMHGVNPDVVKGMNHPVLVRVMPNDQVTTQFVDESNTSSNLQMGAVERANNDARRVNLNALEFNEDGTPTKDSVVQFARTMPETERASMLDAHGQPTVEAVTRLRNAVFAKAYGSDRLASMYSEATDPEARLILNALGKLAPKMAQLEGAGDLDFRAALVEAVGAIVEGKKKGLSISEIAAQVDAFADPDVDLFIRVLGANPRSTKEAVRILGEAADFVKMEMDSRATGEVQDSLFGEAPQRTRADVINNIRSNYESGKQPTENNAENTTGNVSPAQDVAGRNAGTNQVTDDGRGQPDNSANAVEGKEELSLTGQTEEEAKAEAERIQKIQDDEAKASQEYEEQQHAERIKREEKQAADKAVDSFELGDDTVSAEDAVSGQGALFSQSNAASRMDESLSNDSEVGEAYKQLRDSGAVEVINSVDDLPQDIREQIDGVKQSKINRDTGFVVPDSLAFEANKDGRIATVEADMAMTTFRNGEPLPDGAIVVTRGHHVPFKHSGKGAKHATGDIIEDEKRDLYKQLDNKTESALRTIKDSVERTKEVYRFDEVFRKDVSYIFYSKWMNIAVLTYYNGENFVYLTHYKTKNPRRNFGVDCVKLTRPISIPVNDAPATPPLRGLTQRQISKTGTLPMLPIRASYTDVDYTMSVKKDIEIAAKKEGVDIKLSENGDIQGLYNPSTGKTYLIAENIAEGDEKAVLAHEIGVHAANEDKALGAEVKKQIAIARNMVNNGFKAGNKTAVAVKQRLVDAGHLNSIEDEIPTNGIEAEECAAYLAEETVKNDDRGAFRKWFDNLVSQIKKALSNIGIDIELSDGQYADMIKGNISAISVNKGNGDVRLSRKSVTVDDVRKQYEGTDKWMKAPNGEPTKLTERQWLHVRTTSFKKWFGDWEGSPELSSKVLDDNGEPKVVYHGTKRKDRVGYTFLPERATRVV